MTPIAREIGQRIVAGFEGTAVSADFRRLLHDLAVGHVLLRSGNVESPEQVADLVRELQSLARAAGLSSPLLVFAGQDGGTASPFPAPWTRWPPPRALGRLGKAAVEEARRMAHA